MLITSDSIQSTLFNLMIYLFILTSCNIIFNILCDQWKIFTQFSLKRNKNAIIDFHSKKCYWKNNEIDLPTVENCWCMLRFSSFQLFYIPYFENAPKTYNLTSKKMSEDTLLMISVINFIITVCRWRCHISDMTYSKMTIIQNVRDRSLKGVCLL